MTSLIFPPQQREYLLTRDRASATLDSRSGSSCGLCWRPSSGSFSNPRCS